MLKGATQSKRPDIGCIVDRDVKDDVDGDKVSSRVPLLHVNST